MRSSTLAPAGRPPDSGRWHRGGGNGLVDHLLGDLVKGDPVGLVIGDPQQLLEMPGDSLALPVRVGGQKDFSALLGRLLQVVDDLFLALDRLIIQREAVSHVHAQLALGKIAHMSHGRLHLIAGTQVFSDGLGLGGGLHDHKIRFRHNSTSKLGLSVSVPETFSHARPGGPTMPSGGVRADLIIGKPPRPGPVCRC